MSPVLPDGRYRLCVSMGTDPYYIASIPDKPDTLGVLPGDPSRGPIFTLTYHDGDDEYTIMLDDHSVDKNEDGEICLDLPDHKKWKIVRAGESFMIKGGQESCWSPVLLPQNADVISIRDPIRRCSSMECHKYGCDCVKKSCEHADCTCMKDQPENISAMVFAMFQSHASPEICSCSGCPPPCLVVNFMLAS